ncbi:MAG: DUF177 domain-containing protein [Acidobacteriaceae bacterium]|nr:DUF177 domain-containing protein [Acidobacteriaceae bacterium]
MFIAIKDLELRDVRFQVDVPAGEIDYSSEITQISALHATGSAHLLSRSLGEVRIEGNLKVTVNAPCDRCLESATVAVEKRFDLVYMPSETGNGAREDEVDEAAVEVGYYDGAGLALNDVLREVVLLALPMQLICAEACKGICPECGQNLNQGECDCEPQPIDDRWSKLREFRAGSTARN